MPRHDNLDSHFSGALHDCVKVVDLEPEQYPVSVWLVIAIADRAVMVFHLEAVQLKDKLPIGNQLFIRGAFMIAQAAQQTLVPSAACFHIGYGDQRLRTHPVSLTPSCRHSAYFLAVRRGSEVIARRNCATMNLGCWGVVGTVCPNDNGSCQFARISCALDTG